MSNTPTPEKKPLPTWLQSSADPAKVSLTLKGLLVFVPSIVVLAGYFGLSLSPDSLAEGVNQLAVVGAGVATIYGLVRKLWAGEP